MWILSLIPLLAIREIIFITHNMKGSYAPHNLDFLAFFFFQVCSNQYDMDSLP